MTFLPAGEIQMSESLADDGLGGRRARPFGPAIHAVDEVEFGDLLFGGVPQVPIPTEEFGHGVHERAGIPAQ